MELLIFNFILNYLFNQLFKVVLILNTEYILF